MNKILYGLVILFLIGTSFIFYGIYGSLKKMSDNVDVNTKTLTTIEYNDSIHRVKTGILSLDVQNNTLKLEKLIKK